MKSQRKFRPTTAGAIIGGTSSRVRARRRPRSLLFTRTAIAIPAETSTAIDTALKMIWLRSAWLNWKLENVSRIVLQAEEGGIGGLRSHE